MKRWLSAAEALEILKIKPQSLYANVSRKRIRAKPDPADPRRRLYSGDDVDRLTALQSGQRSAKTIAAQAIQWGEPVLASAITTVIDGKLFYRGQDAVGLSEDSSFEQACALLWGVPCVAFDRLERADAAPRRPLDTPMAALLSMLCRRTQTDIPCLGRSVPALAAEASALVSSTAQVLLASRPTAGHPLHERVARAWKAPEAGDAIRRALVLLADHELNASTFTARVAASTGAPLCAAMVAGVATLAGPRHGGASAAVQMLARSARVAGVGSAVRKSLRQGGVSHAFGHPLYPEGDPRAAAILSATRIDPLYQRLMEEVEALTGERANVAFALAAMAGTLGLPTDAPLLLFTLARSAGWMAHAIEQVSNGGLIRPRARYVGAPPAELQPRVVAVGRLHVMR